MPSAREHFDSDLVDLAPGLVVNLLGPLLTVDGAALVKGFYHRPLRLPAPGTTEDDATLTGGGRVTELTARPALARRCVPGHPGSDPLTQFVPVDGDWLPDEQEVATSDRPPLATLRATEH